MTVENLVIISKVVEALAPLAWPLLAIIMILIYRNAVKSLINIAVDRIRFGDELKIGILTIGQSVGELKQPYANEQITDDHLALIHRSWHNEKASVEFGRKMYQIHIIVYGMEDALRRVDYVLYRLDPAYPNPVRMSGPLETNFELKELANGYSLIRAEVFIKGQKMPLRLSRLVDLTDQSPRLKGTYQNMA